MAHSATSKGITFLFHFNIGRQFSRRGVMATPTKKPVKSLVEMQGFFCAGKFGIRSKTCGGNFRQII